MGRYNNPYKDNSYDTYDAYYDERRDRYVVEKVKDDDEGISWGWIIVLFIFFPPLAMVLLFFKILGIIFDRNKTSKSKKKKKKQAKQANPNKWLNIGSIAFAIIGVLICFGAIDDIVWLGLHPDNLWSLVQGALFIVGSFLMRNSMKKRNRKVAMHKKMLAIIGNRPYIAIGEMAGIMGVNKDICRRNLNEMIDEQMLPYGTYIDMRRDMLVLNPSMLPEEETVKKVETEKTASEYAAIIEEIRQLNIDIEDEKISEQIDTIEGLTAQIFAEIEKNPQKLSQVKSFLNYYLPTTLKLLRAYADLENQWGGGENIATAKKDIESIMNTLVECYKLQLDKLFANEKLDIATDIQVLENMMARDGLGTLGQMPTPKLKL